MVESPAHCGVNLVVKCQPSKLNTRVRFPHPAQKSVASFVRGEQSACALCVGNRTAEPCFLRLPSAENGRAVSRGRYERMRITNRQDDPAPRTTEPETTRLGKPLTK